MLLLMLVLIRRIVVLVVVVVVMKMIRESTELIFLAPARAGLPPVSIRLESWIPLFYVEFIPTMVHIVVQEVPEQIGATTTLRSFSAVMESLHAGIAMHVMLTRDDHSSRFQEGELVRIYGISADGFFLGL